MPRPKGSKNKTKKFVKEKFIDIDVPAIPEEIRGPSFNGTIEKKCVNCEPNCAGQADAKWHYGSKDKWCNQCACLALKQ
jgi:hypothetical protein